MKKSRIIIITVIATLVVVFALGAVIKSKNKSPDKGVKVRIEEVSRGELIEFVSAPGEIEPKTKVEISAKVSARVVELPYQEGDLVTAGNPEATPPVPPAVLVKLDSKDMESQLRSAKANYSAKEAQIEVEKARIAGQKANLAGTGSSLKLAEQDLRRNKGLLRSQDISQAAFDQAQCRVDELKAQYESAKHTLHAAELNLIVLRYNLEAADAGVAQAQEALSYTTITSPIDGVVTKINAEVGEVVMTGTMNNPGTVIIEVADLSQMLFVAEVDEADVGKIEVGQQATVRIQAFGEHEFKGTVDSIALTHTTSSTGTKYFRTEILLQPNLKQLFSGLTADVEIQTQKHADILKVPSQAVMARPIDDLPLKIRDNSDQVDQNKTFAAVVYRFIDEKAVVTPVEIGPSDMTHTIILSGLTEGDKIVAGPYKRLESLKHDKKIRDERQDDSKKDTDSNQPDTDANKPEK